MISKKAFLLANLFILLPLIYAAGQNQSIVGVEVISVDQNKDSNLEVINVLSFDSLGNFKSSVKPLVTSEYVDNDWVNMSNFHWFMIDVKHPMIYLPLIWGESWFDHFASQMMHRRLGETYNLIIRGFDFADIGSNESEFIEFEEEVVPEEVYGKFIDELSKEIKRRTHRIDVSKLSSVEGEYIVKISLDQHQHNAFVLYIHLAFEGGMLSEAKLGGRPEQWRQKLVFSKVDHVLSAVESFVWSMHDNIWLEQKGSFVRYDSILRIAHEIQFVPKKQHSLQFKPVFGK